EVEVPLSTFVNLPGAGEGVLLHTHLAVREDAHALYGFTAEADKNLFRALIKVSGVGAKLALAILSGMPAEQFARCVQDDDAGRLTRLPGIGKKTAGRLIMEMRDRLGLELKPAEAFAAPATASGPAGAPTPVEDAVSALIALGYKPAEASRMVRDVREEGLACEELIRRALKLKAEN
ncbi:MAG TPA: Holliday junction branch migration protein RuvA, partial [Gammaproteobacteria bacterium]|nr:Holliday junction branch migration protein RuvA [Gammaproteobacteria bacterium]